MSRINTILCALRTLTDGALVQKLLEPSWKAGGGAAIRASAWLGAAGGFGEAIGAHWHSRTIRYMTGRTKQRYVFNLSDV